MSTKLFVGMIVFAGFLGISSITEAARGRGGGVIAGRGGGVSHGYVRGNAPHGSTMRGFSGGQTVSSVPQLAANRGNLGAGSRPPVLSGRVNSFAGPRTAQQMHEPILSQVASRSFHDARDRLGRHRTRIFPSTLFGWTPYSWWDGYADADPDAYYDYSNSEETAAQTAAPIYTSNTTSPILEQAKAANQLEANSEYRQALADLTRAQVENDSAFARATEKLGANAEYQDLLQQRNRAEEAVETLRAGSRQPSMDEIYAAATTKLELNTHLTKMMQSAVANDPQVSAANAKLMDAGQRVQTLRKQAQMSGMEY